MGRLRSLTTLDLGNQRGLSTIPDSVADLALLRGMNLADCSGLTKLPDRLGQLQNLRILKLKRNEGLRQLPESLGNMTNLKQLDLSHCKNLRALPANLGDLQRLEKLNLTGCTSLRELPASLSRLPANCEILVPSNLAAQLRELRPSQRHAAQATGPGAAARPPLRRRPTALPPGPARPTHVPLPVANLRVAAWKERLAPHSEEDGAKRFSQWMDAVNTRGPRPGDAAKMETIVEAAATSAPLRAKLFTFATDHMHVQRNLETGVTMTHVLPGTFTSVRDAHDVYLAHMVSDSEHTPRDAAYALLGNAIRERYGHMPQAEAIRELAGDAPTGIARADRYAAPPWAALVAYVQAHDEEAQALATQGGGLISRMTEAADDSEINQGDLLDGNKTVKNAINMLMHDRYMAVATELLAQRAPARSPTINPALR
jgi:hypothetical protein